MPRSRHQRIAIGVGRSVVYVVAFLLIVAGLALAAVETGWGKNRLRALIVQQAHQYLTAALEIDHLEGSLLRGIDLSGIRLSREGRTIISIDRVTVTYSLRELFDQGTSIRRIRLVRPHVAAGRQPDGRWDVAALVKREVRQQERTGPRRPIHILSVEVVDGTIELRDPMQVGAAHVPTRFSALNTSLAFHYEPVAWRLEFADMSWVGGAPELTMERLAGGISSGSAGILFRELSIRTPKSAFVLDGRIARDRNPTVLELKVAAERFTFQEWAGILTGLKNIAVEGPFDATLHGPLAKLAVDLDLRSNAGHARGPFVLDTTIPGWHGSGSIALERLNLAKWLNRPDRPSDITGRADFDLDLRLGRAPVGTYAFDGAHAEYFGYTGDRVRARGTLSADGVHIEDASARAYGADVRLTDGSIAYALPYRFRFQGTASRVDLRQVPPELPVPHVESTLAFSYDVSGQFSSPFITGSASFAPSEFLGARIGAGARGTIDTSARPIRYTGEGDVAALDLHRFGAGLDVAWMQDPRYAGSLDGHFKVAGTGADRETMTLDGGGRLSRATFFEGTLSDADVEVHIGGGSLNASYDGRVTAVNPAVPLDDPRFAASLTGTGRARFTVRDLLIRSPQLDDYDIESSLSLRDSQARGVQVDTGQIDARLTTGALDVSALRLTGPAVDVQGSGTIPLDGRRSSDFAYTVVRADLSQLHELVGRTIPGDLVTEGRLTGTSDALQLVGDATITRLAVSGVRALTTTGRYDVTVFPDEAWSSIRARITGNASFVEAFDQELRQVDGTVLYSNGALTVDLAIAQNDDLKGSVKGNLVVDPDEQTVDVSSLELTVQDSSWRVVPATPPPRLRWDAGGIAVDAMTLENVRNAAERIALSGSWRDDGTGRIEARTTHLSLDALTSERPARYGGFLDAVATIGGTRQRPLVRADLTVTDGRVRQFAYQKLIGRVDYGDQALRVDLRLDQSPGVWLTASGTVPLGVFDAKRSEQPMDLDITSSTIGLGLLEGLTTVVRNVTGTMQLDLAVVGTSRDPHFTGHVELADAAFAVSSSGARYKNGRASLRLQSDVIRVETFHLEDNRGRPLEVTGSLGTHELRVGDVEIDARAKGFEVLRNEFGVIEVDAQLNLRGKAEAPRIDGTITVSGGTLNVNEILDRTLFRPYATEAAKTIDPNTLDAVAALNPWDRLGLNIQLRIPGTMRMTGDEVQVTAGTPIGLGDINLRVFGELNLYKDPGDQLYITGSFDSLTGTYAFQGRRFDIDPTSSINFRGDRNPELYVTVQRLISGVETRVSIIGPLREPELRLASTPSLEPTDILSLIVFGASVNDLSVQQRGELAVRAGILATGFLAAPLMNAVQRTFGLEVFEIEAVKAPGADDFGAFVTIGRELAPGLVARFSRQFGASEYDEATIEYYLSRILRIRATFSDAASLNAGSPFRRTERAGIDLILFFSF